MWFRLAQHAGQIPSYERRGLALGGDKALTDSPMMVFG